MKERLEKLLRAKQEQRNTLNQSMIDSDTKEERAAIGETLKALGEEIADIEAMLAEVDEPADDGATTDAASADENENTDERGLNIMSTMTMRSAEQKTDNAQAEARAQEFARTEKMTIDNAEARAMLVSSGKIATPTQVSGINEINNEVSSIVDMVEIEDCEGMGSDKVAYEFTAPTAGVTTEGEAYAAGETVVDYVEIKPTTITTISDISRQVRKQSPLKYEEKVRKNALLALRKKASAIIVEKVLASALNVAKPISAIDEKTLRTIALNYGGDENVIGQAVLFLNKVDLVKFGDVRGSDKKAVYEITPDAGNPNIGVIKDGGLSVKYCLNSNLTEGKLLYGQPAKAKLDLFGNYEVTVSEDFKFDKGLLTIRGNADIGCDVVYKDGFIVATVGE
jgi:HK97 family phage major capsid protein